MTAAAIPSWCEYGSGARPLLLIAPHGGRRRVAPLGDVGRKVNDVHTADLVRQLAGALQASFIVNPRRDRNHLDLNRIAQVRSRAPWFLTLLEHLIGDCLARHARVEVLIIHGWNISQPKCDVGIGQHLAAAADAAAHAGELTTSVGYVEGRLSALRAACAARGIGVSFGERYPARHPNNVLQLFRQVPRPQPPAPRLAAWAAAGRVDAVQLELGIPLRWPGPRRDRFLDAMREVFGAAEHEPMTASARVQTALPSTQMKPTHTHHEPSALQCYDPHVDLGILARIDRSATGSSGRVLLFIDRSTVCLFSGEDHGAEVTCGPHFTAVGDGFRLTFRGDVLATDDGDRYVDLEDAFVASTLRAIEVELHFRALPTPDLGAVSGTVTIDGTARRIDTLGFGRQQVLMRSGSAWRSQLRLAAALAPDRAVRIRQEFPGPAASREDLSAEARRVAPLTPLVVLFDESGCNPLRVTASDVNAEPISRMSIVRPAGAHRQARVSFGVARVAAGALRGYGFYEYARVVAIARDADAETDV